MDDLLDELAFIFSKIDLIEGYHHNRIKPVDVYKTIFRTHVDHFEFRVMEVGLTNDPTIF